MRHRTKGFTLVELLVVIAIIGTLVALLLPAVQSARETARGNTCRNNLKQLMTAMTNMDTTQRRLPGYVNAIVNPTDTTQGRRASWVVMVFPYMEQNPLWDRWSQNFTDDFSDPDLYTSADVGPASDGLVCPSDSPEILGQPSLSYVGNAGQAYSDSQRGMDDREYAANGVFFDNSKNVDILSSTSAKDGHEDKSDYPEIRMSMGYVQSNDGTSKTLMLSESVHAWYYAYDGNDTTEAYEPGFNATKDISSIRDAKHIFGFVWTTNPTNVERVNGDRYFDQVAPPAVMADFAEIGSSAPYMYESYGFPSSNHPNGVNVAFCGGNVQFMTGSVEPQVYSMLMTSNRNRSKFKYGGVADRKLSQPSDDQY